MSTSTNPPTAQHRRTQSILQRLSAALPSTSQTVRRLLGVSEESAASSSSTAASSTEDGKPVEVMTAPTSSQEKPAVQHIPTEQPQTHHEETADPDAPVAMLLPGLSRLLTYNPPTGTPETTREEEISTTPAVPTEDLPDSTIPEKEFISPPSKTPNLLLTLLPLEIQSAIFAQPVLTLEDMMNIRRTCRTWRRDISITVLDQKLRQQNYAGWQVVFEVNGKKYPGTTYGNRRLCGRFVDESVRYKRIYRTDYEVGDGTEEQGEWWEWPEERGMCFPCLWRMLGEHVEWDEKIVDSGIPGFVWGSGEAGDEVEAGESKDDGDVLGKKNSELKIEEDGSPESKKLWKIKLAAVEKKQQFTMMDGTLRKICDVPGCLRDIHENAVPCPHCTDFSEWIHRRRR